MEKHKVVKAAGMDGKEKVHLGPEKENKILEILFFKVRTSVKGIIE
jgi:hypothetical protein